LFKFTRYSGARTIYHFSSSLLYITTTFSTALHKRLFATTTKTVTRKRNKMSDKMMNIMDGKFVAEKIREEIKQEILKLRETKNVIPGLAVVLVGDRKDSATYVNMKKKAAEEIGINFTLRHLPNDISEKELIAHVIELNNNSAIHGIIVQLPLPNHVNEEKVVTQVSIEKDVDGLLPENIGKLAMKGRNPTFVSCTPKGCMELLRRYKVEISGKLAVVIGRSNIVGTPVAMLLQKANATVVIAHSQSNNLPEIVSQADIVIAAVGKPELVRGSWIKPGAVIIDVGTNPVTDLTKKSGFRLVGDVNFEEASKVASLITPVPGGVGPMTVCMLMQNTFESAKRVAEAAPKN